MFEKIGCDVLKLQRVAIGRLRLASLKPREFVYLNDVALERIFLPDEPDQVKLLKRGQTGKKQTSAKRSAGPHQKMSKTGYVGGVRVAKGKGLRRKLTLDDVD